MNQITSNLSFISGAEPCSLDHVVENNNFSKNLRILAARFKMHFALVHKIGRPDRPLKDTTYATTIRNLETSNCTLGDLILPEALEALCAGSRPVLWRRKVRPDQKTISILDGLNICAGVSVPWHNALGNHYALTLCDNHSIDVDKQALSLLALPLLEAIVIEDQLNNTFLASLSNRERDCLQWAAAGKTSLETSIILGLSPHTINQYLTKATEKLGAVNRTHAVTKAVRLGLIDLSSI